MGAENLHHKRKAKSSAELKRQKAKRASYDRVLIVCEDSKSAPAYFESLIVDFRLNTANIKVCGEECGSSPDQVLAYAQKLHEQENLRNDPYDKVFCVIDKDAHAHYRSTIQNARHLGEPYHIISSVPCFEYWLLLHFKYTTESFSKQSKKSCCETVQDRLKAYLPKYQKSDRKIYEQIKSKTEDAIKNARRAWDAAHNQNTDNPSTKIYELVEYLRALKEC